MNGKKVLIVDDDPAIQKVMKMQLEMGGFAVVAVADGRSALEALKTNDILAVLLDLHLADEDGFQVIRSIKKVRPELPVIMVTGSHDEQEARKAFDLGAWDYVTKPIDFDYLKNILLMQGPQ